MKKLLNLFLFASLISIFSCSENCEVGYEGENCDTLINEQFFGIYNTTMSDCGSGNSSTIESINISANLAGDGQSVSVELTRSSDHMGTGIGTIIDGVLNVTVVDVPAGFTTVTYQLEGTIVGNTFTGDERATASNITANCTISMEK